MRSKMWSVMSCAVLASMLGSVSPASAQQPVKVTAPIKDVFGKEGKSHKRVNFALSKQGTKVGEGRSIDLVNAALEHIDCVPLRIRNATAKDIAEGWASDAKEVYIWGGYSQKNGRLFYKPGVGDIIQFERCVFKKPDGTQSWSMPHHTAIVAYADGRKVVLLHQGLAGDGTVRQDYLDLDWLQKEGQFRGWSPSPFVIGGQADHLLRLTNEFRAQNSVAPVRLSDKLNLVAARYAFLMSEKEEQGHSVDGKTPDKRLEAAGYTFTLWAENVAMTPNKDKPSDAAIDLWKNSKKGHRENMLNAKFTEMGAWGFGSRSGKYYYCQVFAKPR